MTAKKTNPADQAKQGDTKENLEAMEKSLDIDMISIADFQALSEQNARTPGPFEGYALKSKIEVGKAMISKTFIVGLNPTLAVHQDPSGRRVTIVTDKRDKNGKKTGGKTDKIITLGSYHSRFLVNHEEGGNNTEVIFDRTLKLKDGEMRIAVVNEHSVRAQLCYFYNDKTERVEVDKKYVLLDMDQVKRLRKVFEILINPHLQIERVSSAITGDSDEDLDTLTGVAVKAEEG